MTTLDTEAAPRPAVNDQAVTVVLSEYERLKTEQLARIGVRDNLLYAELASIAGIAAAVASARILALLLLLPVATTVLGWTYLANDHMVTAIGRYLREDLEPRLAALIDHPGVLFGWERDHRDDRRRRSRKTLQLAVDLTAFTLPPLAALFIVAVTIPMSPLLAAGCLAELAMVATLGWQMVTYADLRRPQNSTTPKSRKK
uniref:hypothetical protein n=1 Tax=Sphaerisporangium sp. CA-236357 TaxID=3240030 RepID=UPI003F499E54